MCEVGYDHVTLTRGAAALAAVANRLAVATSFPRSLLPPAAMGGLRYGRCHAKRGGRQALGIELIVHSPADRGPCTRKRGLGWKARSGPAANVRRGVRHVTLMRGAAAL